jgi:hypothetical protein
MFFIAAFFIAVITAAVGALAVGFVAFQAVDWYRISGREGKSGYFIAACGILGIFAGFVLGIFFTYFLPPHSALGFFKTLGFSVGAMIALAAVSCLITWAFADIPPEIDGEDLFLIVEARYSVEQTTSPSAEPGDFFLTFGSIRRGRKIVRKNVHGPIWNEQAKQVDGRWQVRGAVQIFTSRGRRLLVISLGKNLSEGFLLPLPRWPGKKYLQWSDWIPRPRPNGQSFGNKLTYRFRVQRWSEPMQFEKIGDFEVTTITRSFYELSQEGRQSFGSNDTFQIAYRGQPLTIDPASAAPSSTPAQREHITTLITFSSPRPAMVANVHSPDGPYTFYLLSEADGKPKIETIANSGGWAFFDLSADAPRPQSAYYWTPNRRILPRLCLYCVGLKAVLDTRDLTIYRINAPSEIMEIESVLPLGISPDERSFIAFTYINGDRDRPALVVVEFPADRFLTLPIDPGHMPYSSLEQITPAWVLQYFIWQKDANGIDRLSERNDLKTPQ